MTVSDDPAAAVRAHRRERMDRTLEAVECVRSHSAMTPPQIQRKDARSDHTATQEANDAIMASKTPCAASEELALFVRSVFGGR
jgi:tRNA A37 threonylcarbamoyladenosine dehydratase